MSKNFDVKTVVSAVSGTNIANSFGDVFNLYWYVFDDPYITSTGIVELRKDLLEHLANTYPGLREAEYKPYTRYGVLVQEYGQELEIFSIKELEEQKRFVDDKKTSKKKNKITSK